MRKKKSQKSNDDENNENKEDKEDINYEGKEKNIYNIIFLYI